MLKRDLSWLWAAIAAMVVVLIWLLLQLGRQGADAQVAAARARGAVICQIMRAGAGRMALQRGQTTALERALVDMALREDAGFEGGLWAESRGAYAYAFPTYDGSGVKQDAPAAELPRIAALAQQALASGQAVQDARPGLREAVVYSACPVAPGVAGWTLTRVATLAETALNHLILAVSLLLGSLLLAGAWFAFLVMRWGREAQRLAALLANSERMAALGSLAAGLAHEIRNPLGTIRMKVDNALAAPPAKREARTESALRTTLLQVQRLETLVSSLLALTQPFHPKRAPVALPAWLEQRRLAHADAAAELGLTLTLAIQPGLESAADGQPGFDAAQMERVIDNLLWNALAHTPSGGHIELGAAHGGQHLTLWVADDGNGVPPPLRATLFDPLVTGRDGGTGLGLAVVREVVQAHGGRVRLDTSRPQGTRIELELPWL
ncbi:sensor histidine kinase [Duganella sp. FT94W]|uniref:histidine kinase n=1 Tax=Duganella lactea TaxID=2692173 RepID=A0ABW9V4W3_9BURK|nr:HAMP domain-containing sensor histidine kinase [Duganella lactea]MYM34610.1 sensor histidine kinase [Duganella lactea]